MFAEFVQEGNDEEDACLSQTSVPSTLQKREADAKASVACSEAVERLVRSQGMERRESGQTRVPLILYPLQDFPIK